MTYYVLGFLFSTDLERVALIKKNRPKWQEGLLNGIGGKVEEGESTLTAMRREFFEETGVHINLPWELYVSLHFPQADVSCFVCKSDMIDQVDTVTDEEVEVVDVYNLSNYPTIDNIPFLVELALQYLRCPGAHS